MNCKHCLNRAECAYAHKEDGEDDLYAGEEITLKEHLFKFENTSYTGDVVILGGRLFRVENIKPWEIKLKPVEVNK